ncbi:MAG: hypothetical protein V1787_01845 [Candidatus Micrarchaeota archaeon]
MARFSQLRLLILLFVLVGVTNMISWRAQVMAHEFTHQAIFSAFGIESRIVMHDFGFRAETIPSGSYASEEDARIANVLQAQNELITYHFFPAYTSNLVLQLILVFAIYKFGRDAREERGRPS